MNCNIISRNDPIQEIALDIVFESSHISTSIKTQQPI